MKEWSAPVIEEIDVTMTCSGAVYSPVEESYGSPES